MRCHVDSGSLLAGLRATALDTVAELAGGLFVAVYFVCLSLLAVYGAHRLWLTLVVRKRGPRTTRPESLPVADMPHVTVQCPVFNEPDVAVRLLDAVCALDYPRDRLEIQLLDDSTDETTALLEARTAHHRAAGTRVELIRREDREGFKAGALENGVALGKGELFAVFDADFIPQPDFLQDVVPAFADQEVGMVQARWGHVNRDRSWFTRVQALMLDGHFLVEHAARAESGHFFNFNGTAGVFRKQCIVDAGGWQHDTLTEDLDLSYRAQLAGWRFVFLDDVVAPAELPGDMNAWKGQQRRWTTGSVQSARKLLPALLRSSLAPGVKLEALFHLTNNAAYPLLLVLALTTFPAAALRRAWGWEPLMFIELPMLLATTGVICTFYLAAARREGQGVALAVLARLLAVGVGASLNNTRAVLAGLRREVGEFVRTPKTGDAGQELRPGGHYKLQADGWARLELGFGLFLAAQTLLAAAWGLWPTVPFLCLFTLGFLAVGAGSLSSARNAA